jgi:hypothetical protein
VLSTSSFGFTSRHRVLAVVLVVVVVVVVVATTTWSVQPLRTDVWDTEGTTARGTTARRSSFARLDVSTILCARTSPTERGKGGF